MFKFKSIDGFLINSIKIVVFVILITSFCGSSLYFYFGIIEKNAAPNEFESQNLSAENITLGLKNQIKENNGNYLIDDKQKIPKVNEQLQKEIDIQTDLIDKLLWNFDRTLTDPAELKKELTERGDRLSEDKSDAGLANYAKNRTFFYTTIFENEDFIELLKSNKETFEKNFISTMNYYDDFKENELKKKEQFLAEEEDRVKTEIAESGTKLGIAISLLLLFIFCTFTYILLMIEKQLKISLHYLK